MQNGAQLAYILYKCTTTLDVKDVKKACVIIVALFTYKSIVTRKLCNKLYNSLNPICPGLFSYSLARQCRATRATRALEDHRARPSECADGSVQTKQSEESDLSPSSSDRTEWTFL